MIHHSVIRAWSSFSEPLEGREHGMYLCVRGIVTTGVGNALLTPEAAMHLPWRLSDHSPALPSDVKREWQLVSQLPWGRAPEYYRERTTLRLTDDAIDELVAHTLRANATILAAYYTDWPTWPADAQLGELSLVWAVGAAKVLPGPMQRFPRHCAACVSRAWLTAGHESRIADGLDTPDPSDDNPGVVPRTAQQRVCFANAHHVEMHALDPSVLIWPRIADTIPAPPPTEPAPAISVPDGWNDPTERAEARADARDDYIRATEDDNR